MNKAQEILNEFDELDEVSDEEKAARKAERADAVKFAKELKNKLEKSWGVKLRSSVVAQAVNPWIQLRVAKFGEDEIPNDFRLAMVKAQGGSPSDPDNVSYGNVRSNMVSAQFSEWKELMKKGVVK